MDGVGFVSRLLMDEAVGVKHLRLIRAPPQPPTSAFTGFRFPPEVILIAVRWYLRYGLSYRDLEELLAERCIEVDHVTLFRWVQRFMPLLIDAARPCRHSVGGHWFVDETYIKVSGSWRYVYRAVDQCGQLIDVFLSKKRDLKAATTFFAMEITPMASRLRSPLTGPTPSSDSLPTTGPPHFTTPLNMPTTGSKQTTGA